MAKETTAMPGVEEDICARSDFVCLLDMQSRVHIPKRVMKELGLNPGDKVRLHLNGNEATVRKYYDKDRKLIDVAQSFVGVLHTRLNAPVMICDLQHILASQGMRTSVVGWELSPEMIGTITGDSNIDGGKCEIVSGTGLTAAYVMPIVKSKCYGAILIPSEGAFLLAGVSQKAILLRLDTAARLLADQMEEILKSENGSEFQNGT